VDEVRRLSSAIEEFESRIPAREPIGRDGSVDVDERVKKQLEALGYVVDDYGR
jgi:hypothetical protein